MSWEEHYEALAHPLLLTRLLHEAVPVLKHVNWAVLETAEGVARTQLPLNAQSTNQHGTHQAALIALAADYTGGIALATVLRGVPVLGVHPEAARDNGAALWLANLRISYRAPSVGHLTVSATVPEAPGLISGRRAWLTRPDRFVFLRSTCQRCLRSGSVCWADSICQPVPPEPRSP